MTTQRGADPFIPGLKPRGHEDVLYPTTGELLAALPKPRGKRISRRRLGYDEEPTAAGSDLEVVRSFLHRHGHGSER